MLRSVCTEITKALSDQAKRSLCTPAPLDRNYYRIMKGKPGRFKVECLIYFETHTTGPYIRRSEIHPRFLNTLNCYRHDHPLKAWHTLTQAVSDDVIGTSQHVGSTVCGAKHILLPCMCRHSTVIPRLTKIITFVSRNVISRRFL